MDGFKLFISNTSTTPPSASDLCYHDPPGDPYPKITLTISCYQLGQYVIYYDDVVGHDGHGSIIELCYVAINDNVATDALVSQIQFGTKTANLANDGNKTTCFKSKGTNVRIQVDMTEIRIVTEIYLTGKGCPSTQYGPLCTIQCPLNCHGPCDLDTGNCISGCSKGWIGEKCEEACSSGFYGQECLLNCSINCLTPPCDHTTGGCNGGCTSKWKGFNCTQARSEQKEELNEAAIGGGIGAVIAVILIMIAGYFIYKRNLKSTTHKYSDNTKSIQKTASKGKRGTNNGNKYENSAITLDPDELTVYLKDTKETEVPFERDETVYNNVPTEQFAYKIKIGNLKDVINEKLKDEGFKKEYEILPKGLVRAHVEGSKEENKVKNRFLTTWPYDHSRIVLKGNTKTDYINASYIDNYDKEKAYIASQGPKSNTVRDFWHMIWQENVGKIVMVTQLKEGRREKCIQYWPDAVNDPMVVDNYRLTMTEEKEHTMKVKRDHCDQNEPMVVHCSAGLGRTGTFIAIDAIYEYGKKVGHVDIMEYVQMMRKDRMNMIQTHEQYETVFEALLELFTVPETAIPKNDFCKYIEDQECKTLPKNQKVYKREFQGYRDANRFFVTQCPLKDTVVDFWTMVYDHNSRTIVILDQVYKNAKMWLGKSETLTIGDFTILLDEEYNVDKLKIALKYKEQYEYCYKCIKELLKQNQCMQIHNDAKVAYIYKTV
ncbi:PTPRT [Mytilus edulis]|uniref:protein-tyrosine-phosphatase n=1 Tax=Mytilus edulis TaxID=6550 RepID=A0A8S3QHS5_MYTED|nr:PTPRT [Mytilus edulis]